MIVDAAEAAAVRNQANQEVDDLIASTDQQPENSALQTAVRVADHAGHGDQVSHTREVENYVQQEHRNDQHDTAYNDVGDDLARFGAQVGPENGFGLGVLRDNSDLLVKHLRWILLQVRQGPIPLRLCAEHDVGLARRVQCLNHGLERARLAVLRLDVVVILVHIEPNAQILVQAPKLLADRSLGIQHAAARGIPGGAPGRRLRTP
mmetsp:Transcript_104030/g.264159  ORF Transcript_104030/g.264159 Transcript_104030/m.264159 type:complete len:206 (-) Transcript_104030:388-1005(-)